MLGLSGEQMETFTIELDSLVLAPFPKVNI